MLQGNKAQWSQGSALLKGRDFTQKHLSSTVCYLSAACLMDPNTESVYARSETPRNPCKGSMLPAQSC